MEVAEYNLNYWLHRLEKQEKYTRVFRDYYRADEFTRKQLERKKEEKQKRKDLKADLGEIREQEQEQEQEQENNG